MTISSGGDQHAAQIFGFDTPQEQEHKLNSSVYNARDTLLQKATDISNRAYTPFDGERVAGLAGNEVKASNLAQTGYQKSGEYFDKAGKTIDEVAGNAWNGDTAKKYMDPYVGAVVNNSLRKENTAFQQGQNQLKSQAASMGAFGGDRATLLESQNNQKHLQTVGDITAEGYSKAYSQAFSGWQADNQRKMGAAQAYQQVGGDLSKLNSDQITDLMKTGQTDRVLRQLTDDATYSSFIEKRDWNVNNLQPLMQALGVGNGARTPNMPAGSNAAGNVLGAVSAIAGYFGKNSGGKGGTSFGDGYGGGNNGGTSYDGGDIYGGGGAPDYSGA